MDDFKNELIELTRDLIKLVSVNPPGEEHFVTDYLVELFKKENITFWTIDVENDRKNIVAILKGKKDNDGIIFTGHQDVVPISDVERQKWELDPFSASIKDGKIFGRGSSDMKGGVAAMIMALISLKRENFIPERDIILLITCDEEHYMKGSEEAKQDEVVKSAKCCVVCEPTGMKLCNASRGRTWARIDVIGKTAHGSQKGLGVNAIEKCSKLIEKIKEHDFSYTKHILTGETFWQPYAISAGVEPAIVPDKCSVYVDARLTLGHYPQKVWDDMNEIFENIKKEDADFNVNIHIVEKRNPWETAENEEIVKLAYSALIKENITPIYDIFMGSTDGTKLNDIGIKPIILGPGNLSGVHKENEFIVIDELLQGYLVYKDMMKNYR